MKKITLLLSLLSLLFLTKSYANIAWSITIKNQNVVDKQTTVMRCVAENNATKAECIIAGCSRSEGVARESIWNHKTQKFTTIYQTTLTFPPPNATNCPVATCYLAGFANVTVKCGNSSGGQVAFKNSVMNNSMLIWQDGRLQ